MRSLPSVRNTLKPMFPFSLAICQLMSTPEPPVIAFMVPNSLSPGTFFLTGFRSARGFGIRGCANRPVTLESANVVMAIRETNLFISGTPGFDDYELWILLLFEPQFQRIL